MKQSRTLKPSLHSACSYESTRKAADKARTRLLITSIVLCLGFMVVGYQLVNIMCFQNGIETYVCKSKGKEGFHLGRANILDRNGVILATSIKTYSLYANPRILMNSDQISQQLIEIFPKLKIKSLQKKLSSKRSFVWIARHLTPYQKAQVIRLGAPGLDFIRDQRRIYPLGALGSHVVGFEDLDGNGISGIEKGLDKRLRSDPTPLRLSLDIRLQHILKEELLGGIQEFSADAASGIILDITTGEVLSMVSLPDFDPNKTIPKDQHCLFNQATSGAYEMGSTMKVVNTAIGLEHGIPLNRLYDATRPLKVGRFQVTDYHGKNCWLNVQEIFVFSSNIGSARIALDVGIKNQKKFMKHIGLLDPISMEIPEMGKPLSPRIWRKANSITISYGYGISVTPIQLASAIGGVLNKDGQLVPPTFLKNTGQNPKGKQIVSKKTSLIIRDLMHKGVQSGTSRQAAVPGLDIAGKTGTTNQRRAHGPGYQKKDVNTSFVGAFPKIPRYLVLVMLNNPKGIKKTHGFNAAGWNAAPVAGRVIQRIAPILGVLPTFERADPSTLPRIRQAALIQ